jgi:hypothetical protein
MRREGDMRKKAAETRAKKKGRHKPPEPEKAEQLFLSCSLQQTHSMIP